MRFNIRKIYFIKKDFQTRFILRFVALATVWAAATVMLFAYFAEKKLERLRLSSHFDITTTSELLLPITVSAHVVSLLMFACLLAYSIHSLWRRLSSPLSLIKRGIARVAGGELADEISIKENDEFQDLAADLNEMRRGLKGKIDSLKEQHVMLSSATAELRWLIDEGASSSVYADLFQVAMERMKKELEAFHY